MAVSAVVTRGYGSGIASIALVVTAGYTASSEPVPDAPGLEYRGRQNRNHFAASENRNHFRARTNRLHYTVTDEDS